MGKALMPISHQWDGELLTVRYENDVVFILDQVRSDHAGRLWAQVVAKVGDDVANNARIDLLDQRQRIDFHIEAHARDGQVDWQSLLIPVVGLAQHGLERPEADKESPPVDEPWPNLSNKALHGLAGIMTMAIDPYTEADLVAVLLNILTAFGNIVGSKTYFIVEHTRHLLRIFATLVGLSAKGRKGTSWSTPGHVFYRIEEAWAKDCVSSGLSSGEGLIYHVRDKRIEKQPVKDKGRILDYEEVIVDHGVDDKRLLIIEEEFAQALKVMSREGNILSPILRQAWDTGNLHPLTKSNPIRATDAHISIIGHITRDELLRHLNTTEQANGFANRFLWAMVRRSKKIANPTGTPDSVLNPLIIRLQKAIEIAKKLGEMHRDAEAEAFWGELYEDLSEGQPGLFGAITARSEVQVMRLAAIYAALDGTAVISREHLEAALAVWRYCETSARLIFGDSTGDPVADQIFSAIQKKGSMTRTDVRDLFGRNMPAKEIDRAIAILTEAKRIECEAVKDSKGGRPLTMISLYKGLV
jgi:hypothetical protein